MEKTNDISLTHKNIKASEIIRKKISDHGGAVTIGLLSGKTCDIYITPDKSSFSSTKLHNFIYDFCVFDIVVDLLIRQGGKAKKGNAHGKNDRVGQGRCTPDTVVGAIAVNYFGKSHGDSSYDPVFLIAAVLDWAEIAHNCRGYIELTTSYKNACKSFCAILF